ncbi:unnamed protein product, partial [Pylaiella littoralis]
DYFPDDGTSALPDQFVGPQGPSLDGVLLADLEAIPADGIPSAKVAAMATVKQPVDVTPAENSSENSSVAWPDEKSLLLYPSLPFAACDILPAQEPRRSTRRRTPSVRLQPFPPPVPLLYPPSHQETELTPVDTVVAGQFPEDF